MPYVLGMFCITTALLAQPAAEQTAAEVGSSSANALPASIPPGANVAIIRIEGLIYDFTLESLKRRVERAVDAGATLIVLELDTPGGLVTSALDIAKYIKGQIPVPTVAWINDQAYSAGTLIASACNVIVMSPASTIGDSAPIAPGQNLAETERAKILSPLLEEYRDNATRAGHDFVAYHAMCILGVEVYQIEHKQTGQRRLVNQADKAVMVDGKVPGSGGLLSVITGKASTPEPGKVGDVTLDVADLDKDPGQWKLIKQVHDGRTLLTLNQSRAVEIGLAVTDKIRSETALRTFLGASGTTVVPQTWSEDLAGWLMSPAVQAVLVLALILGAYIEFQTPGIGVAGAVAVAALVLLLGAPFLVGLADVWHLLLFAVGFGLLMLEIFVTPGFGILGTSGIIAMVAALVLVTVPATGSGPFPMPPPEAWGRMQQSVLGILLGFLGSMVGLYFIARYFGDIPILNRLVLRNPAPQPALAGGPAMPVAVSGDEVLAGGNVRVGDVGLVAAQLRPTGTARFGDRLVDVVSLGQWIDPNTRVRVIEVAGNRIVVEPVRG